MQTDIQKVNDVEYDLEIKATAEDLAEEIDKAVRAQRPQTQMKGFRPGRVPLSLVRKLYGKALAYGVAEDRVQKTYESEVLKVDTYDVLGQPTITDLEYDYEGDLRAVVRFGVRPEFKLASLKSVKLLKLKHEVSDEDVDKEFESMLARHAELILEDGPVTETSYVVADMQRLDPESGTPIVGDKQEDAGIYLGDENVMPQFRDALVGHAVGDSVKATLPAPSEGQDERQFEITIKAVKRRELPELDDALVTELSGGKFSDIETFRGEVQRQLQEDWDRRSASLFEADAVREVVKKHKFDVPESVIGMYLDAFVEDLKKQNRGEFPPDFDETQFRSVRREDARQQAVWMFIRDKIVETNELEISEQDRDAHFLNIIGDGEIQLDTMKQYYRSVPEMMDQLDQKLLSEKVFGWVAESATVKELDLEEYQEETKKDASE